MTGVGALDGWKILDFTTLLPGPYATLMLADLGAEVLRISGRDKYDLVVHWPPMIEGTGTTAAYAWLARNKKSIFLDLKKPEAQQAVRRLISEFGYNIVVEQFRPGVMAKLGLDYESLRKLDPGLIYCSLTGYGQTGPLSMRAGHDINYMSRSGNMDCAGRKSTGPVLTNMQVADVAVGSMNTVVGILAAAQYRNRTGRGQYVDVAMLDGMIPFNSMDGACALVDHQSVEREGQLLNGGGVYDFYETADGNYMSVGSLEPKFFADLCIGTGFPEWADGEILKSDPQLAKDSLRCKFRTKTRDEWAKIFSGLDACVEPVMKLSEVERDEHVNVRNMLPVVPLPDTGGRSVRQLGCPIKLSECPAEYRHAGYPEGYHTGEVLSTMGYTPEEITRMTE
jgi:crotonobetainyl-CoA:carnitine CoA-transferase CaiB-like acyl-CoA transferase